MRKRRVVVAGSNFAVAPSASPPETRRTSLTSTLANWSHQPAKRFMLPATVCPKAMFPAAAASLDNRAWRFSRYSTTCTNSSMRATCRRVNAELTSSR
jgi:hypothetical protein